jgi:hypothetical protein
MKQSIVLARLSVLCALVVVICAGCAPTQRVEEKTTVIRTVYTAPPRDDTEALQRFAMQLHMANDARTEAEVLRNLRQYEADHNLTYKMQAVRLDTNTVVASPAMNQYPIRVDLQIFKGEIPLYTISFVPRDNQNVALLGG